MKALNRHRRNNFRGQAMVEFLLTVMILFVILYGAVDIVNMGVIKHTLDSACREGARVASTLPSLSSSNDIVLSRVRKVLIDSKMMNKDSITEPLVPQISFVDGGSKTPKGAAAAESGDIIVVEVNAQYKDFFSVLTDQTKTITGKATSRYLM